MWQLSAVLPVHAIHWLDVRSWVLSQDPEAEPSLPKACAAILVCLLVILGSIALGMEGFRCGFEAMYSCCSHVSLSRKEKEALPTSILHQ